MNATSQLLGLLDMAKDNVALAALLLSSGLLTMVASREAFDHDPASQVSSPMGGPTVTVYRWKYLSEHAERVRKDLYLLAETLRVGITTSLLILMVYVLAASASLFVQWMGQGSGPLAAQLRALHGSWTTLVNNDAILQYLFGAMVILFGPLLIYKLCIVVYRVVLLRRLYGS